MSTTRWAMLAAAILAGSAPAFKVYIFADMEGCTGIQCSEQIDGPRADEGRRAMEEDVNACVTGCFAAGATEVVVRDGGTAAAATSIRPASTHGPA